MEHTKTIKRKQVCEENVFYNELNGANRHVQLNDLTLGQQCNFAFPKKDYNTTTPSTKHWQKQNITCYPGLVFSKVFIGHSGQNTVAPQPGTENSLNQFPNSLYVREHPPLPSEVQKETPQ